MTARLVASIRIATDHPALPGHFPGEPVVPGVVILDQVLEAAERELGHLRITRLAHVKFPTPLRPDEEAHASFRLDGTRLDFEVGRGGRVIARGVLEVIAEGER